MDSKKIRKFAAIALAILVLVYVGYQGFRSFRKDTKTETAMYGTASDTVQAQGFAIRKEEIIDDTYNGVLSYHVADGTRVHKGGVIADIFASEDDAAAQNKVARIDREIANLQTLAKPGDYFASNPTTISSQIYTALNGIFGKIRKNDFSSIAAQKENLQTALNRKQLLTGEESAEDFNSRISALQSERGSITSAAAGAISEITAPMAGYFISSTDGFENVVDTAKVDNLTVSQVNDLLSRDKGTGLGSSVGKICADFNWYLVCVFSDDDMVKFEDVESVYLDIPFASTEKIPATVFAKNRDANTKTTAVIFQCSYMDSDIASVRNETVQVTVNTYSGVLVNERALHFNDVEYTEEDEDGNVTTKVAKNVKGVYVQSGKTLKFVQVFTKKTVNGYAVCKTELNEAELDMLVTSSTIQLYDEVVVEGTDLYDGKLVE